MRKLALSMLLMGIFFYSGACFGNPDRVTFKSALTWREDASGDYLLPKLENGIYQIPEAFRSEGQIQSIIVNWEFIGEVKLEISADNGEHYTAVVNGAPIVSGFISGNMLKWRASALSADSKLNEVKICYTDNSGVTGTFGTPELSGFKFRKPIYINGFREGDLFNYQLMIKIGESKSSLDFDAHCSGNAGVTFRDIRFTAQDGETLLPYYLEKVKGNSPSQTAIFWVKIPQIPPEGAVLYLYYGNPAANSLSSPQGTFDFFDTFSGTDLDANIWEARLEETGNLSLSDSKLKLTAGEIISKKFQFRDGIIEYSANIFNGPETGLIIREEKTPSDYDDTTSQVAYSSLYPGAEHCIVIADIVKADDPKPISAGTKYNFRVIARGTQITFERFDKDFKDLQARVSFNATGGIKTGYLGLKSNNSGKGWVEYDWIRARRYEPGATEARVDRKKSLRGKEEAVALPEFSGSSIAQNGNLILADTHKEGTYISKGIPSSFPIRVIVPSFTEGAKISLAVSADNGNIYNDNCRNNIYYYASGKDFNLGSSLKYRVKISGPGPGAGLKEITLDYRPGKITVVSPNGGEILTAGAEKEITWSALDFEASYLMDISYSTDNGRSYKVIAKKTENSGSYRWRVPDEVSKTVSIKVSDSANHEIYDISDNPFEIKGIEK